MKPNVDVSYPLYEDLRVLAEVTESNGRCVVEDMRILFRGVDVTRTFDLKELNRFEAHAVSEFLDYKEARDMASDFVLSVAGSIE